MIMAKYHGLFNCVTTIGVCVFSAVTPVAALFAF